MAQMEPSIPIDPDKIPEGATALFADMDQDFLIHEVDGGEAVMAIDPVKEHPQVSILTVRDPMAPPGYRVASIALDVRGLLDLYMRTGMLLQAVDKLPRPADGTFRRPGVSPKDSV